MLIAKYFELPPNSTIQDQQKTMISGTSSALSALAAFSTRLQANANNIANANTDGYRGSRVLLASSVQGGVIPEVDKPAVPGPMVYRDGPEGSELVELSNVDLGRELPEMILNSRYFEANLQTVKQENEMLDSILDLKV